MSQNNDVELEMIIDMREHDVIKKLKQNILFDVNFKKIKFNIENLNIGDIVIRNKQTNLDLLIIERKTIADLLSSIKDGRYEEQSYRLNGSNHHNHNIIYLIEGDVNTEMVKQQQLSSKFSSKFTSKNKNISDPKTLFYSSLFSLNYYKGFSVIRTMNVDETVYFLCNSYNKILKSKKNPYFNTWTNDTKTKEKINPNPIPNQRQDTYTDSHLQSLPPPQQEQTTKVVNQDVAVDDKEEISSIQESDLILDGNFIDNNYNKEKDYISVVKKVKKDNITVNNIDEIMLCQIPGISTVISKALIEKFGSIKNLIELYCEYSKCKTEHTKTLDETRHLCVPNFI